MNEQAFEKIINEAFPNPHIKRFIDNIDDENSGFDICPSPRELIHFQWHTVNPYSIFIKYTIIVHYSDEAVSKVLYDGVMPGNDNNEPDTNFVKLLLIHRDSVGQFVPASS